MMRIFLCVAIFFLGKKLRNSPRFAHEAEPEVDSYLSLYGAERVKCDE